ncbi:hypothetical protein AC579_5980 [Pseudocercospora musae]|uniref:Mid2 domain-containing protein n=1 Tax=Pseudocercospora musae TaxID=113226 RepID=A0A139HZV3_9PEZI|nr:hypothetical protein AC579_5980 [Pseudocercospora musae]
MAALEVLQAAQLEFVSPAAGGALRYTPGQQVNVSWNTPWEFTNLEVLQGPREDGTFAVNVLGASLPRSETTYLWNSSSLLGSDLEAPFYFRLQKSNLPNDCDTCSANSPSFSITAREPATSTAAASTSTSTMEASSTSAAPAAAPTAPDVAAAASSYIAAHTAQTQDGLSTGAKLGIGLGVGLGGALLIALLVVALSFVRRRKRRFSKQEPSFDAVDREKDFSQPQPQMQEPVPVNSRPQTEHDSRLSGVADSFLTKSSGKTKSYHGPFEFEDEQKGTPRPGSERLFSHPVTPERMPSILKRFGS